jgi:hypothetical protein
MTELRALCVYCGSSNSAAASHLETAAELGRLAAQRGVEIVFGGGRVGLMGALADGALAEGGRVVGIIPEHLEACEVGHEGLSELVVVDSMHTRKRRMFERADAFCILPGGLGTLDEAFEIITWRQLGLHDKPIVLLDQDGYWAPLKEMLQAAVDGKYMHPDQSELVRSVAEADEVLPALRAMPASTQPVETKWL